MQSTKNPVKSGLAPPAQPRAAPHDARAREELGRQGSQQSLAPHDARAREELAPAAIAVVITPASRRGRQLYDVLLRGSDEVIVRGSRDPEHDTARVLLDRGQAGCMTTYRQGSAVACMRIAIAQAAERSVVECATSGPRVDLWRPMPDGAFHANGDAKDGDRDHGWASTAARVDRRVACAG